MEASLEEQKAKLEQALSEGRVSILGERGKPNASKEFVKRLGDFPPTFRRLAIAKACALPWRDRLDELPACFRWELLQANAEANEDRAAYPHMHAQLDRLFAEVQEPISELVLRQIAEKTPTSRYFSLLFVLAIESPGGMKSVFEGSSDAPEWLLKEFPYAQWVDSDEFRAWREEGWVE